MAENYYTVIGAETAKESAEIYTDNPALIDRLSRLMWNGNNITVLAADEKGVRYDVPKELIKIKIG